MVKPDEGNIREVVELLQHFLDDEHNISEQIFFLNGSNYHYPLDSIVRAFLLPVKKGSTVIYK